VTDVGVEAVAAHMAQLHAVEITELPITARSLVALASRCLKLTHLVRHHLTHSRVTLCSLERQR
jgi:hypothetical protein